MNTLVLEPTEHGDMPVDVYQKLASDRILFVADYLDDNLASDIVSNFLFSLAFNVILIFLESSASFL